VTLKDLATGDQERVRLGELEMRVAP
jgi:hypothetical protein